MPSNSIIKLINSDDPLSDEAIDFIIKYHEEDSQVDYKESFDGESEKEWLSITKDIMAFANFLPRLNVFSNTSVACLTLPLSKTLKTACSPMT